MHVAEPKVGRADLPDLLLELQQLLVRHLRTCAAATTRLLVRVRVHELAVEHEQHVERGEVGRVRAERREAPKVEEERLGVARVLR